MQFSQKYTIVQFIEEVPEETEFSCKEWPLHATAVDIFAIDWDVSIMTVKLTELLAQRPAFYSKALDDTFFGPEQQTRVTLLEETSELVKLHSDILATLQAGGLRPNNPQFVDKGFRPHVTVRKQARLHTGDSVKFHALSLIDMFPSENPYQRKVLKTILLSYT